MRMKFTALFLVFSLLVLTGNLISKEKRGAILKVQEKDGREIRGELIAVKEESLLLLVSGSDVSVDVDDVNIIKIIKKSKTLLGASIGFLAGVSVGALGGLVGWDLYSWAPKDTEAKWRTVGWAGVITGIVGASIGGHIGGSRHEKITIEGKSPEEVTEALEKLRKKARISDYE